MGSLQILQCGLLSSVEHKVARVCELLLYIWSQCAILCVFLTHIVCAILK